MNTGGVLHLKLNIAASNTLSLSSFSSLLGVIIDLLHLMKPGGFDVSSFFRDIVSPPEDESELEMQLQPCDKLEDLKKRVNAKELKKRTLAR